MGMTVRLIPSVHLLQQIYSFWVSINVPNVVSGEPEFAPSGPRIKENTK